jgi:hypothetical protein
MKVIDFEERSCGRTRSYLDAYLSNELTVETNLDVLRHLAHCLSCREALATRQSVKEALKRAIERQRPAPAALQERIRKSLRPTTTWRHWALAVAAAVMLVLGGWGVLRWPHSRSTSALPSQAGLSETLSERTAEILKIGLSDHVNCALHQDLSAGPRGVERMSRDLGPDYIGLVPLVKDRVPPDYTMMVAHRCRVSERDFVHLILTNQQTILSVILTKKRGESFDQATALKAWGVPLYRTRWQDLEVAGFETRAHLAYVVSSLAKESNFQIASNLAPAVRDFIAKLVP